MAACDLSIVIQPDVCADEADSEVDVAVCLLTSLTNLIHSKLKDIISTSFSKNSEIVPETVYKLNFM
jgi:hypothetical protein